MTRFDSEFPETRASLLLQLQGGADQDTWLDFVATYRPVIYRLARKRGLQDADAQDLAQQVLISIAGAIERWSKHDASVRFRHWLRRVAKNAICNALARKPPDRAAGGTSIQNLLAERVEADDLEREVELERRRELFLRAANIVKTDISTDTWEVFRLAVIEGLPIEQVAGRLNKTVGAAYACRGRVMNRLRHIVDRLEPRES